MTRSRARSTNITMFIPIPCQAGRLGNGPIAIVGSSHISLRCLINLFEYPEATPPGYHPFCPASLAARHFAARLLGTWQHVALREQQVSGQGFVPRNSYTQRGNLPVVGQPIYRGPNFYSVYFSKKKSSNKTYFHSPTLCVPSLEDFKRRVTADASIKAKEGCVQKSNLWSLGGMQKR